MPYPCPKCDAKTTVKLTRNEWRIRKCISCGHKFTTMESEEAWSSKNLESLKKEEWRVKASGVLNGKSVVG